jgi:hypothetical protein
LDWEPGGVRGLSEFSVRIIGVGGIHVWVHSDAVGAGFDQACSCGGSSTKSSDVGGGDEPGYVWKRAVRVVGESDGSGDFTWARWRAVKSWEFVEEKGLCWKACECEGNSVAAGVACWCLVELPGAGGGIGGGDHWEQIGHCAVEESFESLVFLVSVSVCYGSRYRLDVWCVKQVVFTGWCRGHQNLGGDDGASDYVVCVRCGQGKRL